MPSTITSDPAQPDHDPVQPESRAVQPEYRAVPTLASHDVDAATATRLARLGFALMPADPAAAAPGPRRDLHARRRHDRRRALCRRGDRCRIEAITEAECDILALLTDGRTNAEIAAIRGVSRNTVRTQLRLLYRKIGVTDRAGAVAFAERQRLTRRATPAPSRRDRRP